jgi:hypothetical protein
MEKDGLESVEPNEPISPERLNDQEDDSRDQAYQVSQRSRNIGR